VVSHSYTVNCCAGCDSEVTLVHTRLVVRWVTICILLSNLMVDHLWIIKPSRYVTSHPFLECRQSLLILFLQRPCICHKYEYIAYKLSLLVYKCLHNAAPLYLSSDCVPVSSLAGRQQLRLDSRWRSTVLGHHTFRVCGHATWNALLTERHTTTVCLANKWKLACSRALTESALDDILDCLFCAIQMRILIDWLIIVLKRRMHPVVALSVLWYNWYIFTVCC